VKFRLLQKLLQEDMQPSSEDKGLAWQIGVWDGMAQPYEREVDRRFASVVEGVVQRAVGRAVASGRET